MRLILFIGCAGALIFCAGPHLPLRLLLSAAALLALVHELGRRAPLGYQDEHGFHVAR